MPFCKYYRSPGIGAIQFPDFHLHPVPSCAIIVPYELEVLPMKALTYIEHGKFALLDKPKPEILDPRDAIVRVTLESQGQ